MPTSRLQHEIGKKQPFERLEEEAGLSLLRTHDQIQIHFVRLFREYGLTPSQYNVLRILRGEGKPMPILEIASRLITVVPGITGLIDRLEAVKLVERHRCEADRRVIHVEITDSARDLLGRIDEPLRDLQSEIFGRLSPEELQHFIQLLETLRTPPAPDSETPVPRSPASCPPQP